MQVQKNQYLCVLYRVLFGVPLGLIATRQGIDKIMNNQYLSFPQCYNLRTRHRRARELDLAVRHLTCCSSSQFRPTNPSTFLCKASYSPNVVSTTISSPSTFSLSSPTFPFARFSRLSLFEPRLFSSASSRVNLRLVWVSDDGVANSKALSSSCKGW